MVVVDGVTMQARLAHHVRCPLCGRWVQYVTVSVDGGYCRIECSCRASREWCMPLRRDEIAFPALEGVIDRAFEQAVRDAGG